MILMPTMPHAGKEAFVQLNDSWNAKQSWAKASSQPYHAEQVGEELPGKVQDLDGALHVGISQSEGNPAQQQIQICQDGLLT